MPRYARHRRKTPTRAELIARNLKRRAPEQAQQERRKERIASDPAPTPTPVRTDQYVGYRVVQYGLASAPWFKLLDPSGKQVGKASRSAEEVRKRIPGTDG